MRDVSTSEDLTQVRSRPLTCWPRFATRSSVSLGMPAALPHTEVKTERAYPTLRPPCLWPSRGVECLWRRGWGRAGTLDMERGFLSLVAVQVDRVVATIGLALCIAMTGAWLLRAVEIGALARAASGPLAVSSSDQRLVLARTRNGR